MEVVSYISYAGFVRRLIAFLLDRIVLRVLLLTLLGYSLFMDLTSLNMLALGRDFALVELILMGYFVICESSSWQGTLGKRALGMKVVSESYQRISAADAIIRYLSKYLSFMFLCLGYIWIIFDSHKQGWHDKIARTYVISG
jgi:uncharacterized RDD family membrane protein YckC